MNHLYSLIISMFKEKNISLQLSNAVLFKYLYFYSNKLTVSISFESVYKNGRNI